MATDYIDLSHLFKSQSVKFKNLLRQIEAFKQRVMSEYAFLSKPELEARLAIAEARLSVFEEQERRRAKAELFKKEFDRCKAFLEANGFMVVSGHAGNYSRMPGTFQP